MFAKQIAQSRLLARQYGPRWSAPVLLILLTLYPALAPLNPGTQIAWLEVMAMVWSTALFLHLYQQLNIRSRLGLYLFYGGMTALVPIMVRAQDAGTAPNTACNGKFFLIGPMLSAIDTSLSWFFKGVLAYSMCAFMVALVIVFFLVVIVGLIIAGAESHNSKRTLFEVLSQYLNIIITMMVIATVVALFNIGIGGTNAAPPATVGAPQNPNQNQNQNPPVPPT